MPLIPSALTMLIRSKLKSIPIASSPLKSTVTSSPSGDGTSSVSVVSPAAPVYMDDNFANVIATAVAECVCEHLKSAALVTGTIQGTCPNGAVTGTCIAKIT